MPYTEHWIALICPLTGQQVYSFSRMEGIYSHSACIPVGYITTHAHTHPPPTHTQWSVRPVQQSSTDMQLTCYNQIMNWNKKLKTGNIRNLLRWCHCLFCLVFFILDNRSYSWILRLHLKHPVVTIVVYTGPYSIGCTIDRREIPMF